MRIIETPDWPWQPWEIVVDDESRAHPMKIRPEPHGMGTTGMVELEFSYPDYLSTYGDGYVEMTWDVSPEVLAEALRRMGWKVEKP